MAYTVMDQKADGDPVTASDWNKIVNNFAAGVPGLIAAKGDMVVGTGSKTAAKLAAGANNKTLIANSSETAGAFWGEPGDAYGAGAKYESGENGTYLGYNEWSSPMPMVTEFWDIKSAQTTNVSWKFTCPAGQAGYYVVISQLYVQIINLNWYADKSLAIGLFKNGVIYSVIACHITQATKTTQPLPHGIPLNGIDLIYLDPTDYIDYRGYQTWSATNAPAIWGIAAPNRIFVSKIVS